MKSTKTATCRLSGEDLSGADVLFELESCPFPGIYPDTKAASMELSAPLRVVQAQQSRFVQLSDHFDPSMYSKYAFAGGGAAAYRKHLQWFTSQVGHSFDSNASILEVGTGDGFLLGLLNDSGFAGVRGIDPSRAAEASTSPLVIHGFFPTDLPNPNQKFDLIICRHVLEHIDDPKPFLHSIANALTEQGQLWIEVPDLDSAVERELWSNFYQLHCNYFNSSTLDQLCAASGLRCVGGETVEIFGGSILRRYQHGAIQPIAKPDQLTQVGKCVSEYCDRLANLATDLPSDSVGYGAAERTAAILGFGPSLANRINRLYDGNQLLEDRYLAGTELKIDSKESLFRDPPSAIVLFALSNTEEIIEEWKQHLNPETLVAIPSGKFTIRPLGAFP